MAIINSLAVGKARGKAGAIVYTVLNGQSIIKERNFKPNFSKELPSLNSRAKMSNAVKAWQFLAVFMSYATTLRKPTESVYNAFVRLTKNLFATTIADFGYMAAGMLDGYSINPSNLCSIAFIFITTNEATVDFSTNGLLFNPNLKVRLIVWNQATGVSEILYKTVTAQEWDAGSLVFTCTIIAPSNCGVYFIDTNTKKISNIMFGNNE